MLLALCACLAPDTKGISFLLYLPPPPHTCISFISNQQNLSHSFTRHIVYHVQLLSKVWNIYFSCTKARSCYQQFVSMGHRGEWVFFHIIRCEIWFFFQQFTEWHFSLSFVFFFFQISCEQNKMSRIWWWNSFVGNIFLNSNIYPFLFP